MKTLNKYVAFLFFLGLLFKLGDIGTTLYLVSSYGTHGEANPWIRFLMESQGVTVALVISFIQASFCWILGLYLVRDNIRHQLYFVSIFVLAHLGITVSNLLFICL